MFKLIIKNLNWFAITLLFSNSVIFLQAGQDKVNQASILQNKKKITQVIKAKNTRPDIIVNLIRSLQTLDDSTFKRARVRNVSKKHEDFCEARILITGEKDAVERIADLIINHIDL